MSYIAIVGFTVAMKVGPLFGVTMLDKTFVMVEEKIVPALFRRLPANDNEDKKDKWKQNQVISDSEKSLVY